MFETCLDETNLQQKLSYASCQVIQDGTAILVNNTWNVNITIASKIYLVKSGGINTNKINTVELACV